MSEWNGVNFKEIGNRCGGLLEVDSRTTSKEVITAVRLKVVARCLSEIPRTIEWKIDGLLFVLLIEVELTLLRSSELKELVNGRDDSGERETQGKDVGPRVLGRATHMAGKAVAAHGPSMLEATTKAVGWPLFNETRVSVERMPQVLLNSAAYYINSNNTCEARMLKDKGMKPI